MSRTCVEQLVDSAKEEGSCYSWSEALVHVMQKKPLPSKLIDRLIQECQEAPAETHHEYLVLCRSVFSLVVICHFGGVSKNDHLQEIYAKLLSYKYPNSWQLPYFYKMLVACFLGYPTQIGKLHLSSKGIALIEYGGHDPHLHLPHPLYNAELALLGLILGLQTGREDLIEAALEISRWVATTIEQGWPLWMQEETFDPVMLTYISKVLLKLTAQLTANEQIKKVYHEIQEAKETNILASVFSLIIEQLHVPRRYDLAQHIDEESKYLGYMHYTYQHFSSYATVAGAGTGFAGFAKGAVKITSMGPHTGSLGDMSRYGIYRTPLLQQTPFKDVVMQKDARHMLFSGWTGVVEGGSGSIKPGPIWLRVQLDVKEERARLQTMWVNSSSQDRSQKDLYITLFVKGKKLIVDGKYHLYPSTLDRYQGVASDLVIQDGNESLTLFASHGRLMQVIPLAGEGCFWGAQFLIAYPLQEEETLLLEIS